MSGEPSAEEWEQAFGADLRPHLAPAGRPAAARQPIDMTLLPVGAHAALAGSIGRHGLEDLLIVPSAARPYGRLRRRCLYTPMCILGAGERAVALWVQALPAPGIRALVPLSEISSIARQASGTRRQLVVTGRTGRLPVRYDAAGDVLVDAWVRRLRRSATGDPAPVPAGYSITSNRRHTFDPEVLRLDPDDDVAAVDRYEAAWRRPYLLAITPRELVISRSARRAGQFGRLTDSVYVPRRAIEGASIRSGSLLLRSSGLDLNIELRSRRTAATASAWLRQILSDHDRSGTGS
jgi:hypothetical protein